MIPRGPKAKQSAGRRSTTNRVTVSPHRLGRRTVVAAVADRGHLATVGFEGPLAGCNSVASDPDADVRLPDMGICDTNGASAAQRGTPLGDVPQVARWHNDVPQEATTRVASAWGYASRDTQVIITLSCKSARLDHEKQSGEN
jgi:hypothetical protein